MLETIKLVVRNGWRTFLGAIALFGIFQLPHDIEDVPASAEPWRRLLSAIDREAGLWAFSTVLIFWLAWTDLRPKFLAFLAAKKAARPEPESVNEAKQRLHESYLHYVQPAFGALNQAAGTSVGVVREAWADHPASFVISYAYGDAYTHDTSFQRVLGSSPVVSSLRLPQVEATLLKVIHQYSVMMHILHGTVDQLIKYDKPIDVFGFKNELSDWLDLHKSMCFELKQLQRVHSLKAIRAYSFATYLEDPRFHISIFEQAVS